MKTGIFSDIHGNIYAFDKIWKTLEKEACDRYFFAGDICGYYYYADQVIDKLKSINNLISVRGNHDEMFFNFLENSNLEISPVMRFGKAYTLLKENITKENISFLKNLPESYVDEEKNIALFHGSPWNYTQEYIYPDDSLDRFESEEFDVVFLGHTHYPMYREVAGKHIINPGSCGQPRDKYPPSYAVFDTLKGECEIKHVEYDRGSLVNDIRKIDGPGSSLEQVLMRW